MLSPRFILLAMATLVTVLQPIVAFRCPGREWFVRKDSSSCYFIYVGDEDTATPGAAAQTFEGAQRECVIRGGRLLATDDNDELNYVLSRLSSISDSYWISMTYKPEGWVWIQEDSKSLPFDPAKFPDLKPYLSTSNPEGLNTSATLRIQYPAKKFVFEPRMNSDTLGFICKAKFHGKPLCKTEDGWSYDSGRCYLYVPEHRLFDRARESCFLRGGYIATINSEREDAQVKWWLRQQLDENVAWLGISIENKTETTTIADVKWEDGTSINDTEINHWPEKNLSKFIQSLANGKAYCGEIFSQKFGILDSHDWSLKSNCLTATRPFVCETELNSCPYGWDELDNNGTKTCFQLVQEPKSWDEAQQSCLQFSQKAGLVTIKDEQTQRFIRNLVWSRISYEQTPTAYWIGAKNAKEDQRMFKWLDGTSLFFSNWTGGIPPDTPNRPVTVDGPSVPVDYCVFMDGSYFPSENNGNWNASVCTLKLGYVCAAAASVELDIPDVIMPGVTCDEPFKRFHDGCYLIINETKNREEAQRHCEEKGSYLVSINTLGENNYLLDRIPGDSWIGLKAVRASDDGKKLIFQYANGNSFDEGSYNNYLGNIWSHDASTETKQCYFMISKKTNNVEVLNREPGRWFKDECSAKKAFICYHDGEAIPPKPLDDFDFDPECGPGWEAAADFCYKVNPDATTWATAKQNCHNAGPESDLLYITTKQEEMLIRSLVANDYFVGPLPAGWARAGQYWINFYADKKAGWYWPFRGSKDRNHIPMALFNWASGQPTYPTGVLGVGSISPSNPRCAFMQGTEEAGWESSPCGVNRPYICKKPRRIITTTTAPAVPPTGYLCPTGFFPLETTCLFLNRNMSSWQDAEDACHQKGGELLSIHNAQQYQSIQDLIRGSWIGLNSIHDPIRPRVFSWSDNSPVTYTPWNLNEGPTDLYGLFASMLQSNCVAGTSDGYAVYECDEPKYSVCETTSREVSTGPDTLTIPHADGCNLWGIGNLNSCYYFGQNPTTPYGNRPVNNFNDARTFCQVNFPGSDLAIINSRAEEEFLSGVISGFGSDYWIGLREDSNPWNAFKKWIDGSTVLTSNWAYGEPRVEAHGSTGCVALQGSYNNERYPGDWYVDGCDAKKYALCESFRRNVPTRPPTSPRPNTNGCPKYWYTVTTNGATSNRCYKGYYAAAAADFRPIGSDGTLHKATWDDAEAFCQRFKSGHLASIESQEEQNLVLSTSVLPIRVADYSYWIGLREVSTLTQGQKWLWSDGTAFTTNFFHPTVNHESELTDCAAMDSSTGKWVGQNCRQSWGWVCEVPKGAYYPDEDIQVPPTSIPVNTTCGVDNSGGGDWYFIPESGECMYISNRPNSWETAVFECGSRESFLAVVTPANSDFIIQKASQYSNSNAKQYWIGLRVVSVAQQKHEWIDTSPLTFSNWETGQPNTYSTDYCVTQNSVSGKWKERRCSDSMPYICVKPTSGFFRPSPPPTQDPTLGGCAPGWQAFRGNCYYVSRVRTEDANFANAAIKCQAGMPNGKLASILDSAENDFLITTLRGRFDASPQMTTNVWIGLQKPINGQWAWTDGKPYRYTNWYYDYPKAQASSVDCIEVVTENNKVGKWTNVGCYKSLGYVCKAPKDLSLAVPTTAATNCTNGFRQLGDACFNVISLAEDRMSWDGARAACKDLTSDKSSDIATISDVFENSFIRLLMNEYEVSDNEAHQAWIGMREISGHYSWYNTCPATFSSIGSLINQPKDDLCVYANQGKWYPTSCKDEALDVPYAVCEKRLAPCPPAANITGGYCPTNFSKECANHCFHIEGIFVHDNRTTRINFSQARSICRDLGGDLASIRNVDDQSCITSYINGAAMGLWMGLTESIDDKTGKYTWNWLDEDVGYGPSSYSNWERGEPGQSGFGSSREGCAEIYPNGRWNNVRCENSTTRGYVCEAPKIDLQVAKTSPTWEPWTSPKGGATVPPTENPGAGDLDKKEKNGGMSSGSIAGLVIGILIVVGILGSLAFVHITGRTQAVLNRVRSATSGVREASVRFVPKKYKKSAEDTQQVIESNEDRVNPNYVDSFS